MLNKFKTLAKDWASDSKKRLPRIKNSRNLIMCERCYSFYYKNSWHFERPEYLSEVREEEIPVLFRKCVACLEEEDSLYNMESGLAFGQGGM